MKEFEDYQKFKFNLYKEIYSFKGRQLLGDGDNWHRWIFLSLIYDNYINTYLSKIEIEKLYELEQDFYRKYYLEDRKKDCWLDVRECKESKTKIEFNQIIDYFINEFKSLPLGDREQSVGNFKMIKFGKDWWLDGYSMKTYE